MSLTSFTVFPCLPLELRRTVWAHAANAEPRTLDIWTSFTKCEIANTVFYIQTYQCELSSLIPPAIFRVNSESRTEALKHYSLEFATGMTVRNGISVTISPKMYINYSTDILIPRGHWNIISFSDFAARAQDKLATLAIDVNGSFWSENMRDYCKKGVWIWLELEKLILYDSSEVELFKGEDVLERFRQRHADGGRDLSFMDLRGEPSQKMVEVKGFLEKMFERIERGGEEKEQEVGEDGEPAEVLPEVHPSYLDELEMTEAEDLERPVLQFAELVAKKPESA